MSELVYSHEKVKVYLTENSIHVKEELYESAVILALHKGKVAVLRHYREPVDGDSYELPGGTIEKGESPELAARRELNEEAALDCEELIHLGSIHACSNLINRVAHLFFAKETTEQEEQHLGQDEKIAVEFYEKPEVLAHMISGEWKNSEMAHALFLAMQKGLL
ncbi:NUDIX hydrolase [Brevibacillus daliensis]|uniref:NUDIX hydrolase n=1 Tax=Brevibacillus daliensis TaxID=2892995 RepID=UPI001E33DA24|nr:NUDIX hydrolase [Brevibacillus daliensis]